MSGNKGLTASERLSRFEQATEDYINSKHPFINIHCLTTVSVILLLMTFIILKSPFAKGTTNS